MTAAPASTVTVSAVVPTSSVTSMRRVWTPSSRTASARKDLNPARSAFRRYRPGLRSGISKFPFASLRTVRTATFVSTSVSVISTPGTTALEGSVTVPRIVDLSDWAESVPPAMTKTARPSRSRHCASFLGDIFGLSRESGIHAWEYEANLVRCRSRCQSKTSFRDLPQTCSRVAMQTVTLQRQDVLFHHGDTEGTEISQRHQGS